MTMKNENYIPPGVNCIGISTFSLVKSVWKLQLMGYKFYVSWHVFLVWYIGTVCTCMAKTAHVCWGGCMRVYVRACVRACMMCVWDICGGDLHVNEQRSDMLFVLCCVWVGNLYSNPTFPLTMLREIRDQNGITLPYPWKYMAFETEQVLVLVKGWSLEKHVLRHAQHSVLHLCFRGL